MNLKSIGHNPPKTIIKFFDLLINFVTFQLIVSGICPFMWKSNSSGSKLSAALSYIYLNGNVGQFDRTLGSQIPDAVTFICAFLIAIRWNEIKLTIHRIRTYEAEYLDPPETLLAFALTSKFCQIVYYALYALSLMSVYILAILFSIISLTAGRLCYRIKQCLSRSMEDETALSRALKDHLALCNLINKLSQQSGSFFMLFYIQLGLHILLLINGIADQGMGMSAGMQMQSGMTVILLTVILTLCMIYTSEQADVSQGIQDLADQATDHEKRLYYYGCLHRVTYKPSGFSLGGIVFINRPFVATIVGVCSLMVRSYYS